MRCLCFHCYATTNHPPANVAQLILPPTPAAVIGYVAAVAGCYCTYILRCYRRWQSGGFANGTWCIFIDSLFEREGCSRNANPTGAASALLPFTSAATDLVPAKQTAVAVAFHCNPNLLGNQRQQRRQRRRHVWITTTVMAQVICWQTTIHQSRWMETETVYISE